MTLADPHVAPARADGIPPLIQRVAERAARGASAPERVRITQVGEMWMKPNGRPLRFTATQEFAVTQAAFSWRARFPLLGPLSLSVVDEFAAGRGGLDVKIFGVPLQRQRSPETTAGEALRYLAELAWVPFALLHNDAIAWRAIDERSAEASLDLDGQPVSVVIDVDRDGDIGGARSGSRPRKVDRTWILTPWGGSFAAHATLAGIRIPTRAEAHWDLPGGRFRYWRATVTSAELLAA
jgi:hypothetical protein